MPRAAPNAVRITGGSLRGRVIEVPRKARPTEGRVREALFAIWQGKLEGARFLDLFAGSGAVALEAVSRGAERATCLESDLAAVRLAEASARHLTPGRITVKRLSLPGGLADFATRHTGKFDLVFADPPYRFDAYPKLIAVTAPLLAEGAELCVEHDARTELPEAAGGLVRSDERRYGEVGLCFYSRT